MTTTLDPPVSDPSKAPPVPGSRRGRRALAAALSLAVPGLGQIVAGQRARGAGFLVLWIAALIATAMCLLSPPILPGLAFMVPVLAGLVLWSTMDAMVVAGRSARPPRLRQPLLRYALAVLIAAVGIGEWPEAVHWINLKVLSVLDLPLKSSPAMQPSFGGGDTVFIHKLMPVERWDVVAYYYPLPPRQLQAHKPERVWIPGTLGAEPAAPESPRLMFHRVVGLPGETVEIIDGTPFINGKPVELPPPLKEGVSTERRLPREVVGSAGHAVTLGEDEYYVVGDNTEASYDSRYLPAYLPGHHAGAVPAGNIVGIVTWTWKFQRP